MSIDTIAYSSRLRRIDPVLKLLFVMIAIFICLWADQLLISMVVLAFMVVLTTIGSGASLGALIKLMMIPVLFLVISILTIMVNTASSPSGFLAAFPLGNVWVGVSYFGFIRGVSLLIKALASVSCMYLLSLSTPMVSLLEGLRRLKVPKLLVELMGLVYRFIFVLLDTMHSMITAQNSRLGYQSASSGYRSLGVLGSQLFLRSYKRSDLLFTALESRGYNGSLDVLPESYSTPRGFYAAAVVVDGGLLLLALYFKGIIGVCA